MIEIVFPVSSLESATMPTAVQEVVLLGRFETRTARSLLLSVVVTSAPPPSNTVPLGHVAVEVTCVPFAAFETEVFTSTDGKAHLNLITCFGSWDTDAKQYTDRFVIFTDKV